MSRRHWLLVMVGLLIAGAAVWTRASAGAQKAAAVTTHYRTVVGIDFHPLDYRVTTQFFSGSGGGVYPESALTSGPQFLEAPIDLPVGATVTSVSFYYRDCGRVGPMPNASYYFGSYAPASGGYVDALPPASRRYGQCDHTYTFTRSKASITRVAATRRYVLGTATKSWEFNTPTTTPQWLIVGARVKYTCPGQCS